MECDCKPDSACTATSRCGEGTDFENAVTDLWNDFNSVMTGLVTVVGYLLYRFSQALPALIRWPIRIICSLTGLQTLLKWLARVWRFIVALLSKLSWVPTIIKAIAGSLTNAKQCLESVTKLSEHMKVTFKNKGSPRTEQSTTTPRRVPVSDPGLRLILVGPCGGERSSLGDTLLGCGCSPSSTQECTSRRAWVDGREVTVVDTPDLLGASSLSARARAREALRSLQLACPGPHAILLVLRAPSGRGDEGGPHEEEDSARALSALLELVGEGAASHVLVVLTHVDDAQGGRPSCTLARLLEQDRGGLRAVLLLCGQQAELVADGAACPGESRGAAGRRLLERVVEMRALRGHYTHELQRREQRLREGLLADMADVLARKLGGVER